MTDDASEEQLNEWNERKVEQKMINQLTICTTSCML